jgi:hypothetical protein
MSNRSADQGVGSVEGEPREHRESHAGAHPSTGWFRCRRSGSVEDRAADGAFQRGDLLAHGRLGIAEPVSRPPEGAFLGDVGHRRQVPPLDVGHEPDHS